MSELISCPKKWAEISQNLPQLLPSEAHHPFGCDASVAVAGLTKTAILCGLTTELFSDKTPAFVANDPNEDKLRPIDVLYGQYIPEMRVIEIFVENIRRDASMFGDFDDLLQIIRIHEHAHSIFHLGIKECDLLPTLENRGIEGLTDWNSFTQIRTTIFNKIDARAHELIAQAITYAVARRHPVTEISNRLVTTFLELEKRQPEHYVLTQELKEAIDSIDWPILFDSARNFHDLPLGLGFDLRSGLGELITRMHTGASLPTQQK